ncbi:alginate export family protein [Spongiibacter nanhainus]|uniref:Alginate export family protein n=1 Tax=Spongiibacter nanhainus TaxID=2794344 RepID=A0A7T4UQL8_9GAMM|nr:alginate export family protein [Spongiibacter nanhainus]QQD18888.1 alginate export family protein [Spongiibacter nanhainus]
MIATLIAGYAQADTIGDAVKSGTAYGDFRLRYESVDQDNAVDDATALTLRTKLGYTTAAVSGFSATLELEDNRIVAGEGDYTVGPAGYKPGEYSVIADPETTELDQAFVQYKGDMFTAKLGRQVLTYDGHRFVGHVGWRQDKQTFDGLSFSISPSKDLTVNYAYITQRNRIFAEAADEEVKDHLLNVSYTTPVGKLVAYSYRLKNDYGNDATMDTSGVSFTGAAGDDLKVLYSAEIATQSAEPNNTEFDADYHKLEGGVSASGITAKLGYEVLGSDDGNYGFLTPLATLHKFNGWADTFIFTPAGGLVDTYISVAGGLAGGKWMVVYHDFSADDDSSGVDNYGDEINAVYSKKFGKYYNAGIKYASYSADEFGVDTDKLWVWVGMSF